MIFNTAYGNVGEKTVKLTLKNSTSNSFGVYVKRTYTNVPVNSSIELQVESDSLIGFQLTSASNNSISVGGSCFLINQYGMTGVWVGFIHVGDSDGSITRVS